MRELCLFIAVVNGSHNQIFEHFHVVGVGNIHEFGKLTAELHAVYYLFSVHIDDYRFVPFFSAARKTYYFQLFELFIDFLHLFLHFLGFAH